MCDDFHEESSTLSQNMMFLLGRSIGAERHTLPKQGKSEGFDSCDWPSNLTQVGVK